MELEYTNGIQTHAMHQHVSKISPTKVIILG